MSFKLRKNHHGIYQYSTFHIINRIGSIYIDEKIILCYGMHLQTRSVVHRGFEN